MKSFIMSKVPLLIIIFLAFSCGSKQDQEYVKKEMYRANRAFLDRKFDDALDITSNILNHNTNYDPALLLKAKTFFYTGKYKEAEKLLLKIQDQHSYHSGAALWLSRIYYQENKYDKSIELLTHIINSNPENALVHYYLAKSYEQKKDFKNAIKHYQKSMIFEYQLLDSYAGYTNLLKKIGLKQRYTKINQKKESLNTILYEK